MPYTAAECLRARKDFPALQRAGEGPALAYLDGPGGSQVPLAVIEAIRDVYTTCNVNTHGNFPPSREIDRRVDDARSPSPSSSAPRARVHLVRPKHDDAQLLLERRDGRTLQPATKF
jgi:hypothetical protein